MEYWKEPGVLMEYWSITPMEYWKEYWKEPEIFKEKISE